MATYTMSRTGHCIDVDRAKMLSITVMSDVEDIEWCGRVQAGQRSSACPFWCFAAVLEYVLALAELKLSVLLRPGLTVRASDVQMQTVVGLAALVTLLATRYGGEILLFGMMLGSLLKQVWWDWCQVTGKLCRGRGVNASSLHRQTCLP